MSNQSSTVSESSTARRAGKVVGIPRRCWCGEDIVTKVSRSEGNPNRKFFRCVYAVSNRETNEKHVFKWVDEAILEEFEIIDSKLQSLHQDVMTSRLESEKMIREFEFDIIERVETAIVDAKTWFKRVTVVLCVIFIMVCISLKIIGS